MVYTSRMTMFKLNTVSTILLEDDYNKNIIPLVVNIVQNTKINVINVLCYEHPASVWKKVFDGPQIKCYESYPTKNNTKTTVESIYFIDSLNQMVLDKGFCECLKQLKKLQNDPLISRVIMILHRDCLSATSKLQIHLNHIADAIISFGEEDSTKINVQIKKGGKISKSKEILTYDKINSILKLCPVPQITSKTEEPEKISPSNLSTFKIETDQIQQLEKHKLKLPYMSKINEGQGKVYYEPDAVDDWDEEDPDDDLEI